MRDWGRGAALTLAIVTGSAGLGTGASAYRSFVDPEVPFGGAGFQGGSSASPDARWQDVIRNLRHPDAKVRLAAVEQLGSAGYSATAEYVAPLVTDSDNRVQFAAIDAELTFFLVESIGERHAIRMTGGSHSRAQEAFDAGPLVRVAGPAPLVLLDNLIAAMRDGNARIRFDAVHALGVIAESPIPPAQAKGLVDGLDHYDPVIRAATARVIGRLRIVDAGDKLIAGLNDASGLVRRYCADALGRIREERAIQSLTERAAFYRSDDTAAEMLLALARIGHASSLEVFRSRLNDANPQIRRAAAEGLGRLGDGQSLGALKTMMAADPSVPGRLAAAFAVGGFGESQSHVIAAALASPDTAPQARDYLIELGPAAIPGVESALGVATDGRFRADLVHVLGFTGTRDTVRLVEPFLKDKDGRVSRAAANAINRLTRS
jgi:HEAT repeat protein